jgi:hypothetical protein
MKSSLFCDITPSSSLNVIRRLDGTCRLHLQDRRVTEGRNRQTEPNLPRTTRRYIPENKILHNRRCENLISHILHETTILSLKMYLFLITHVSFKGIWYLQKASSSSLTALQPLCGSWPRWFRNCKCLRGGVVSPHTRYPAWITGDYISSGPYPLTSVARVSLPGAYASASIAIRVMGGGGYRPPLLDKAVSYLI